MTSEFGRRPNLLRDWHTTKLDRLPGLKWMRTLWVASVAGGPYKYVPTVAGKCPFGLENAHAKFQISSAEFDEVARVLAATLDAAGVKDREKKEVLAAFAAHKNEIVNHTSGKCPFSALRG